LLQTEPVARQITDLASVVRQLWRCFSYRYVLLTRWRGSSLLARRASHSFRLSAATATAAVAAATTSSTDG